MFGTLFSFTIKFAEIILIYTRICCHKHTKNSLNSFVLLRYMQYVKTLKHTKSIGSNRLIFWIMVELKVNYINMEK